MIEIADPSDPRLSDYRALGDPSALAARGLFVAEGRLVVRRLLEGGGFAVRSVLVTPAAAAAVGEALAGPACQAPVYVVPLALMEPITGYNIHRGCLAIAERPPRRDVEALLDGRPDARRIVVLEGVGNADNVGGIFRNAAAFGADAVVIGPRCCDPLYRKAVRTSSGAALAVPFADVVEWPAALDLLRRRGFRVVALTPADDAEPLDAFAARRSEGDRVALLVGAEGDGLSPEALAAADVRVRIPIDPTVDSLNAAVAAGIALYGLRSSATAP